MNVAWCVVALVVGAGATTGRGEPPRDALEEGREGRPGARRKAAVGTVQGAVDALDWGRGLIQVTTSSGPLVLNASPDQLAALSPGDLVRLEYEDLAGHPWVASAHGVSAPADATLAVTGTLRGAVTAVDKASGVIVVEGRPLRAHPAQLVGVLPGHLVEVVFGEVQGVPWLLQVESIARP